MKVYVASSWRNNQQPHIVSTLREHGHKVYDFKSPEPGNEGFHWHDVRVSGDFNEATGEKTNWRDWSPLQFREALDSPLALKGFSLDMNALKWCDACVLVLPCGKSAHLELGYAVGAGKRAIVFIPLQSEAELMYSMCNHICISMGEVLAALALGPLSERCVSCGGPQ